MKCHRMGVLGESGGREESTAEEEEEMDLRREA